MVLGTIGSISVEVDVPRKNAERLSEEFAQQRLIINLVRITGREFGRIEEVSEKWFREVGTGKSNFLYKN